MENIEQLKVEVDEIKNSLNVLKNDLSLSDKEKKDKAKELKTHADTMKQKIQKEIDSLTNKTDSESKKKKEEAEILLNSFNEITNLYTSIINSPKINDTPEQSRDQSETENKNIFSKTKDWIGGQRSDLKNRDKWKEQPGKTTLRILGFGIGTGLVGYGVYKGVKKLWNRAFGREKKKSGEDKEMEETSKKKEKKSFWNTTWGNVLKWTGITTAAGGSVYALGKAVGGTKENVNSSSNNSTKTSIEESSNKKETAQKGGDKISEDMFQQLLKMEGSNGFSAKIMSKDFGEKFPTGPYGQVYKYLDSNGNLLNKPVPFKNGETVSQDWALKNARAHYDVCAKERKKSLDEKGLNYNQNELDSLVSASGGTTASKNRLKSYVFSHWSDKNAIFNFMSTFATTAAGNGKVMPGLVSRRKFEANWFIGNKQPFSTYQKRRK